MSKNFSKTRKTTRKQKSKRNKKTRSNRKIGGGFMDMLKSPEKKLLDDLYLRAISIFQENDVVEQDLIKDAIDNLSKLGKNVPGKEEAENPYKLDNYKSKEQLLEASEKIKQTKIMYIKSKGTSEPMNEHGLKNTTKETKCVNLCKELGLVKRKRTSTGLQQKFFTYEGDTMCADICDPDKRVNI